MESKEEGFENEAEETDGAWLQGRMKRAGEGGRLKALSSSARGGGGN